MKLWSGLIFLQVALMFLAIVHETYADDEDDGDDHGFHSWLSKLEAEFQDMLSDFTPDWSCGGVDTGIGFQCCHSYASSTAESGESSMCSGVAYNPDDMTMKGYLRVDEDPVQEVTLYTGPKSCKFLPSPITAIPGGVNACNIIDYTETDDGHQLCLAITAQPFLQLTFDCVLYSEDSFSFVESDWRPEGSAIYTKHFSTENGSNDWDSAKFWDLMKLGVTPFVSWLAEASTKGE